MNNSFSPDSPASVACTPNTTYSPVCVFLHPTRNLFNFEFSKTYRPIKFTALSHSLSSYRNFLTEARERLEDLLAARAAYNTRQILSEPLSGFQIANEHTRAHKHLLRCMLKNVAGQVLEDAGITVVGYGALSWGTMSLRSDHDLILVAAEESAFDNPHVRQVTQKLEELHKQLGITLAFKRLALNSNKSNASLDSFLKLEEPSILLSPFCYIAGKASQFKSFRRTYLRLVRKNQSRLTEIIKEHVDLRRMDSKDNLRSVEFDYKKSSGGLRDLSTLLGAIRLFSISNSEKSSLTLRAHVKQHGIIEGAVMLKHLLHSGCMDPTPLAERELYQVSSSFTNGLALQNPLRSEVRSVKVGCAIGDKLANVTQRFPGIAIHHGAQYLAHIDAVAAMQHWFIEQRTALAYMLDQTELALRRPRSVETAGLDLIDHTLLNAKERSRDWDAIASICLDGLRKICELNNAEKLSVCPTSINQVSSDGVRRALYHIRQAMQLVPGDTLLNRQESTTLIRNLLASGEIGFAARVLHETGILGKIFSAWHSMTNIPARNEGHSYSLCEHHLQAVQRLTEILQRNFESEVLQPLTSIDQDLVYHTDILPLVIATLVHDKGHAERHDNELHFCQAAQTAAKQLAVVLQCSPEQIEYAGELALNHLVLYNAACHSAGHINNNQLQRLVSSFSSVESLSDAFALSLADKSVSRVNGWKKRQSTELTRVAGTILSHLKGSSVRSLALLSEPIISQRIKDAIYTIPAKACGIDLEDVKEHFSLMSKGTAEAYRANVSTESAMLHIVNSRALRNSTIQSRKVCFASWYPITDQARNLPFGIFEGQIRFVTTARDRVGLVAHSAAILSKMNFNIAQMYAFVRPLSTNSNETVAFLDITVDLGEGQLELRQIESVIHELETLHPSIEDPLTIIRDHIDESAARPLQLLPANFIVPQVKIFDRGEVGYLVVNTRCEDQKALAARLSDVAAKLGYTFESAQIRTGGSGASDDFRLRKMQGTQIEEKERIVLEFSLLHEMLRPYHKSVREQILKQAGIDSHPQIQQQFVENGVINTIARELHANCPSLLPPTSGRHDWAILARSLVDGCNLDFVTVQKLLGTVDVRTAILHGFLVDQARFVSAENVQSLIDAALADLAFRSDTNIEDKTRQILTDLLRLLNGESRLPTILNSREEILLGLLFRMAADSNSKENISAPEKISLPRNNRALESWLPEIADGVKITVQLKHGGAGANMLVGQHNTETVLVLAKPPAMAITKLMEKYPNAYCLTKAPASISSTPGWQASPLASSGDPFSACEVSRVFEIGEFDFKVGSSHFKSSRSAKYIVRPSGAYNNNGEPVANFSKAPLLLRGLTGNALASTKLLLNYVGRTANHIILNNLHYIEQQAEVSELAHEMCLIRDGARSAEKSGGKFSTIELTLAIHAELSGVNNYILQALDPRNLVGINSLALNDQQLQELYYLAVENEYICVEPSMNKSAKADAFTLYLMAQAIVRKFNLIRLHMHGGDKVPCDLILRTDLLNNQEGKIRQRLEYLGGVLFAKYITSTKALLGDPSDTYILHCKLLPASIAERARFAPQLAERCDIYSGNLHKLFISQFIRTGTWLPDSSNKGVAVCLGPTNKLESPRLHLGGVGDLVSIRSLTHGGFGSPYSAIKQKVMQFDRYQNLNSANLSLYDQRNEK